MEPPELDAIIVSCNPIAIAIFKIADEGEKYGVYMATEPDEGEPFYGPAVFTGKFDAAFSKAKTYGEELVSIGQEVFMRICHETKAAKHPLS